MPFLPLCLFRPARAVFVAAAALTAGCTAGPGGGPAGVPDAGGGVVVTETTYANAAPLPPMKRFPAQRAAAPIRPNAQIARDFLELSFLMESGRPVPRLSRFEGPISLVVTGDAPPTAREDAGKLAARLRAEAGIPVRLVPGGKPQAGNVIVIQFLPRATMQSLVPEAACFVVPRVSSWDEYRAERRSAEVDWTTLETRDRAAVFIPSDTSPQEVRDCLHEEISQALGPLNDLYRLPDSIFNDDNFQAVLTGFDMLILRLYYAPEIQSGMTRAEVAARLPALLRRMNPRGGSAAQSAAPDDTPRAWIDAVETALGPRATSTQRRSAAMRAVEIAQDRGWSDARAGFSWFALGRLNLSGDMEVAFTSFLRAALIYRAHPGMEVQAAHVDMQLAAFALSAGQAEDALTFTDRSIPAVRRAENAALLSTLLLLRAEALELLDRKTEARATRLDALGWARYGFGEDAEVWRRVAEIAALSPRGQFARLSSSQWAAAASALKLGGKGLTQ